MIGTWRKRRLRRHRQDDIHRRSFCRTEVEIDIDSLRVMRVVSIHLWDGKPILVEPLRMQCRGASEEK